MRVPVSLRESINTDTLEQDVKPIAGGPHRINTGIERDGGLTNLYLETIGVTAFARTIVSDSGKIIQIGPTAGGLVPVTIDTRPIGSFTDNYLKNSCKIDGKNDAAITSTGTIVTVTKLNGTGLVKYEEFDTTGRLINFRNITFAGGPTVEIISIVRKATLTFAANLEVLLVDVQGAVFKHSIEGGATTAFTIGGGIPVGIFQITPYVYKYENANSYLISSPNDNVIVVGNIVGGAALPQYAARYAVLQYSGGFSRHILTKVPVLNGNNVECVGIIGHNAFTAVFTAAPAWQFPAGMNATAVGAYQIGYGYAEAKYTQGGNPYILAAPQPVQNASALTSLVDGTAQPSATSPFYNPYGRLANNYGTAGNGAGPSIRTIIINGTQSHLSYQYSLPNTRGVIISTVGEFDPLWTPCVYGTNNEAAKVVLYKYNGSFYGIETAQAGASIPMPQRIARDVYRLPFLGLHNIIDATDYTLRISGDDYNGRAIPATGSSLVALRTQYKYGNSVDVGDKTNLGTGSLPISGMQPPATDYNPEASYIDVYINDIYSYSINNPINIGFINSTLSGSLYVANTTVPIPAGNTYYVDSSVNKWQTFFTELNKDVYKIGNKLQTAYQTFRLFGNLYAFDNVAIYLIPVSTSGFIQTMQYIANAQKVSLIGIAPTQIFFYSTFDNSIYTFDGGRSLVKGPRFNSLPSINQGVWSVTENTLALETDSSIIFVRDGIVSSVDKLTDMVSGVTFWVSDADIYMVTDSNRYRFTYNGGGNPFPFTWKSAFWGMDATRQQYISQIIYTIYSPTKEQLTLLKRFQTFDEGQTYDEQIEAHVINPSDYSSAGFVRIRYQPRVQRGLASSAGLSCDKKIVLLDVAIETREIEAASIAAMRSN